MRKTNNDKILFNEMTRVQMPALVIHILWSDIRGYV